jgi:hypothetical protein
MPTVTTSIMIDVDRSMQTKFDADGDGQLDTVEMQAMSLVVPLNTDLFREQTKALIGDSSEAERARLESDTALQSCKEEGLIEAAETRERVADEIEVQIKGQAQEIRQKELARKLRYVRQLPGQPPNVGQARLPLHSHPFHPAGGGGGGGAAAGWKTETQELELVVGCIDLQPLMSAKGIKDGRALAVRAQLLVLDEDGRWVAFGQTEVAQLGRAPAFTTPFVVRHRPGVAAPSLSSQAGPATPAKKGSEPPGCLAVTAPLRLELGFIWGTFSSGSGLLGAVEFTLGALLTTPGSCIAERLPGGQGSVAIRAVSVGAGRSDFFRLDLVATELPPPAAFEGPAAGKGKKGDGATEVLAADEERWPTLGQSAPPEHYGYFVEVARKVDAAASALSDYEPVARTPVVWKARGGRLPRWATIELSAHRLCYGRPVTRCRLRLYRHGEAGWHTLIGEASFQPGEVLRSGLSGLEHQLLEAAGGVAAEGMPVPAQLRLTLSAAGPPPPSLSTDGWGGGMAATKTAVARYIAEAEAAERTFMAVDGALSPNISPARSQGKSVELTTDDRDDRRFLLQLLGDAAVLATDQAGAAAEAEEAVDRRARWSAQFRRDRMRRSGQRAALLARPAGAGLAASLPGAALSPEVLGLLRDTQAARDDRLFAHLKKDSFNDQPDAHWEDGGVRGGRQLRRTSLDPSWRINSAPATRRSRSVGLCGPTRRGNVCTRPHSASGPPGSVQAGLALAGAESDELLLAMRVHQMDTGQPSSRGVSAASSVAGSAETAATATSLLDAAMAQLLGPSGADGGGDELFADMALASRYFDAALQAATGHPPPAVQTGTSQRRPENLSSGQRREVENVDVDSVLDSNRQFSRAQSQWAASGVSSSIVRRGRLRPGHGSRAMQATGRGLAERAQWDERKAMGLVAEQAAQLGQHKLYNAMDKKNNWQLSGDPTYTKVRENDPTMVSSAEDVMLSGHKVLRRKKLPKMLRPQDEDSEEELVDDHGGNEI